MTTLDILRQLATYGTLDDPQVAVRLSVGLSEFVSLWERETLPFVAAGGAELRFVEGPYGRGKTHFLQALEVAAEKAGFVTSRVQCGMQHKPFESLAETYRAVANTMQAPCPGNGTPIGLCHLLDTISAEQLRLFQDSGRANPGFRNLVVAYSRRVKAGNTHDPLTLDLAALLHHDASRRVTFKEMLQTARNLAVTLQRPLGRVGKRNAAVWLRSLLTLPRQLGFKGLVVLFDETGSDLHLRPEPLRSRQQHMANLRNLVDHLAIGAIPGCAIVYATTSDFIQMAREDYPALAQRVERLEKFAPFSTPPRNPRAIWTRLDELTNPPPDSPVFFSQLGERLMTLAGETTLPATRLMAARGRVDAIAAEMSHSNLNAAVRDFIKRAASAILRSN